MLALIATFAVGQTAVTEVATDGYISKASYIYVFGTTADTMTNATADTAILRVKGSNVYDFNIKLYTDHVSGTAGGTLILANSMDGVNYANVDTITSSSVTGDLMDTEVINLDNYLYPYARLIYTQTGTAVTVPKAYIYAKEN